MLSFMQAIFTMPFNLTKFVFDEELLLFYIRIHYISFVKLYHKNYAVKMMHEEDDEIQKLPIPGDEAKNQKL